MSNIINRHLGSENVLAPRVRGVFEPRQATLGSPNIQAPWLGNDVGTAENESNDHFQYGPTHVLSEPPNADRKMLSNEAVKKSSPAPSIGQTQNPQEQTIKSQIVQNNYKQLATQLHKAGTLNRSVQLAQQRVSERVRFEVPRDEKSVSGFSSEMQDDTKMYANAPNRQAEQVIKPLLKTKTPIWQEATPWLQKEEGSVPTYSSKVYPKPDAAPSIKVHIGRIEIKAVKETPVKQARPQKPENPLSLDEFLKKRDNKLL